MIPDHLLNEIKILRQYFENIRFCFSGSIAMYLYCKKFPLYSIEELKFFYEKSMSIKVNLILDSTMYVYVYLLIVWAEQHM